MHDKIMVKTLTLKSCILIALSPIHSGSLLTEEHMHDLRVAQSSLEFYQVHSNCVVFTLHRFPPLYLIRNDPESRLLS